MRIGYARVSTQEQDTQLQTDALKKAGCEIIYEEKASGSKLDRLELENCLKSLRKGDELVVWKLDRLGRSLTQLINIIEDIREKGVEFSVITENIDTSTPSGKMMFHHGTKVVLQFFLKCYRYDRIEEVLGWFWGLKTKNRKRLS